MKIVPILVVTNAVALGLVALLWMEQEDLKTQLSSTRNHSARTSVATNVADSDRIAQLERVVATLRRGETMRALPTTGGETAAGGEGPSSDSPAPLAGPAIEAGEDVGEGEEYDPAQMEPFRRMVRQANALNAHEDRVRRVARSLDQLVEENKIGSLSEGQKERVAESVLAHRAKAPQFFRDLRRNNNFEGMERTEIRALFTAAREDFNASAMKELEDIVPAADAKTIVESTMNERSMWRGDGGGGRFPLTGGNRSSRRSRGGQGGNSPDGPRRGR